MPLCSINNSKCVLIIGATAGIGRALALSIHALPSRPTVIVTGRRQDRLDELAALSEQDGRGKMAAVQLDIGGSRDDVVQSIQNIIDTYPELQWQLDAVVFSAAVQHVVDFRNPESIDLDALLAEINLNYATVITMMVKCFVPHFLKLGEQGHRCLVIPITSGLGIVPAPWVPNYSATKAALHSLSLSMNVQLREKNIHVIEISPPLVESELHDHQGTSEKLSKFWMPLEIFTSAAMEGLQRGEDHVTVGSATSAFERFEKGKLDVAKGYYESGRA
ncbi:hypothetical protein EWM64_g3589 [Hericium alpestre]|uniref:NAD(P)-binding protein n=1 Tax=Hericium alpestre TaxID=135208 RepID=A0A4Z0A1T6_9AGAM|nr:hypothetical protein EWM64_g3589 [Hericium alpestre]